MHQLGSRASAVVSASYQLASEVVMAIYRAADEDSWDRYEAEKWLNIRRWLDANTWDELYGEMRAELTAAPVRHAR
jgi:hypothetical protein